VARKSPAAVALGRRGGARRTPAQRAALAAGRAGRVLTPEQRALARLLTQLYSYRGAALSLLQTATRPTPARHQLVRLLAAFPARADVLREP
jgi:hypothetical protein